MIVIPNEEYFNKGPTRKQAQIYITTGQVDLQISQDGLPFQSAKIYTQSTLELIDFVCACNYRFIVSGTAQVSLQEAYFALNS